MTCLRWLEGVCWSLNWNVMSSPSTNAILAHWRNHDILLDALESRLPYDLLVCITTYNRPTSCARLVRDLKQQISDAKLKTHLVVIDDASTSSYVAVEQEALAPDSWKWVDMSLWHGKINLGKKNFWKIFQTMFHIANAIRPRYVLFLQDDLELTRNFLCDTLSVWNKIDDEDKVALYLFRMEEDPPDGRWISFSKQTHNTHCSLTRWLDLPAFFVNSKFFEVLQYQMFPILPLRWWRRSHVSSGVGEQLTRRLYRRGNIYQVRSSLVYHGVEPSIMNPDARAKQPFDNRKASKSLT